MTQHSAHTQPHQHLLCSPAPTDRNAVSFSLTRTLKAGKVHTLINRVWSSSLSENYQLQLFPCCLSSSVPFGGKSCSSPTLLWPKGQAAAAAASGTVSTESIFSKSCCVITGALTRKRGKKKLLQSNMFKPPYELVCIATARQWRRLMKPSCGLVTVVVLVPGRCSEAPQTRSSLKVPSVMPKWSQSLEGSSSDLCSFWHFPKGNRK